MKHNGNSCRRKQDKNQGITELFRKSLCQCFFLRLPQHIFSIMFQPDAGLFLSKTCPAIAFKLSANFFYCFVFVHLILPSSL